MQERVLGNGLKVSVAGLGCMGFSHAYGMPTEEKEAMKLMQQKFMVLQKLCTRMKNNTLGTFRSR